LNILRCGELYFTYQRMLRINYAPKFTLLSAKQRISSIVYPFDVKQNTYYSEMQRIQMDETVL
jgi:hypothetical protein